ncbi:MAG: N-acetyltransferase [Eubacteriales bacterium]|nr:N-acetyltransferase [Eubacteriales bacterium]
MIVRPLERRDVPACLEIYNYYIENTSYSFEEEPLSEEAFAERLARICRDYACVVAEEDRRVVGYAYLDRYAERSAYRYTADLSIYVRHDLLSRGVGTALLKAAEAAARRLGLRQMVSIVTSENENSRRFHLRHGFTCAGELREVGYKFGRWHGTVFLQKTI